MSTLITTSYLFYLEDTILKDIEKLKLVADEGEKEYIQNLPPPYSFGPQEIPTTLRPPLSHFEYAITQPSRCTIPLAMICLSVIEHLGNLISPSCNLKFQNGAKCFFEYSGENISEEERELLRAIYRNGLMHSVFPKGNQIGITYDSSLENRREIFVFFRNSIILNVNFLSNMVIQFLNKILIDSTIHEVIEANLSRVTSQQLESVEIIISNYKNSKS